MGSKVNLAIYNELVRQLERLTEQVSLANSRQHAGIPVGSDLWSYLYQIVNESKAVVAEAKRDIPESKHPTT